MTVISYGATDVGRRRKSNEDSYFIDDQLGFYVVADGMGGHAAGEIASRLAVEALVEVFRGDPTDRGVSDREKAIERLRAAVAEANRRICESIRDHSERRGMGTTMVSLLIMENQAIIGHVGDSRAYLLREGRLHRLTSDHSWVFEQVKAGLLTDDDAQKHPMRNIVTRALGSRASVTPELTERDVLPGDIFLLCSDGLNAMLSDHQIRETLIRHREDPEAACHALVDAANSNGGEDNTTVIVLSL